MTTDSKKIFLDTNMLVYSTLKDFDADKYVASRLMLSKFIQEHAELYISTQVIREFYSVVSNEKYLKNALKAEEIVQIIDFFSENFKILSVDIETINILKELVLKHEIKGKMVHDANIVATMNQHNISLIATYNKKDFDKFKDINII